MKTIDQRILIAASSEEVWAHISDISNNPSWQIDCASISFLTSLRKGPGVRWRYVNNSGREYVVEATAWYDRIGYEYTFIDGAPFRKSSGVIRLQETPEGTVIQWTFSYEMRGIFGGIRSTLNTRRNLESMMSSSLWELWQHIKESGNISKTYNSQSLMRDAPDVEERARYKPRHPSTLERPESPEPLPPAIPEPPISDDDTRPRRSLAVEEPDFLVDVPNAEPQIAENVALTPEVIPEIDEIGVLTPEAERETSETFALTPETEPESATLSNEPTIAPPETIPEEIASTPAVKAAETEPYRLPLLDDEVEDTSRVSVFEVFGLEKPSETQELRTVSTDTDIQETGAFTAIQPGRSGLRRRLRQMTVKLRRPK